MPPHPPTAIPNPTTELEIDEPYNSASDSDFDPDAAAGKDPVLSDSSDDDDNTAKDDGDGKPRPRAKATKRKGTTDGDGDGLGGLDSGDEATVRKGQKRRRKAKTGAGMDTEGGGTEEEVDEGGEGGLVKTRAQRAREEKERKPLASAESATVDVDALWRNMTSARRKDEEGVQEIARTGEDADTSKMVHGQTNGTVVGDGRQVGQIDPMPTPTSNAAPSAEETITIKRTYVFAGETITEEKQVPKTSAEARLHFQSQQEASRSASAAPMTKPPLRRPKKRTSMFEPNPEGTVKGLTPTGASANKGPKLNTIEKSKLDWAGFVDKEGIQEELDGAGKAKEGYLGRMDFLGRVEAKREEEAKGARRK